MYEFYQGEFKKALPGLASQQLLAFVLHEYDQTIAIEDELKAGTLDEASRDDWDRIGPTTRRALKFIAEQIVLMPSDAPALGEGQLLEATELLWICAEEMVNLAVQSDYAFMLFPDEVTLTIHAEDAPYYWTLDFSGHVDHTIARVAVDRANRTRFVPQPEFVFDFETQNAYLGDVVRDAIAVDYKTTLSILLMIIESAAGDGTGFDLPFLNIGLVTSTVAEAMTVSPMAVAHAIQGFTVSKTALETDPREIWQPKHEHRAFRRGFFECPHASGLHVMFSKRMATECLAILGKSTVFGQLPFNWRGTGYQSALSRLSNAAGKWFERAVADNLKTLGISGIIGAKDGIGFGHRRIEIPAAVGELDFVGYSSKDLMLVILECKMSRDSTEPRLFRDDVSDFVTSANSYKIKFARKVAWVMSNATKICEALKSVQIPVDTPPTRIGSALVTFVPSIAARLITEFPCVSLTEFMLEYESAGRWPFDLGVSNIA
jgi:hypothetical protein